MISLCYRQALAHAPRAASPTQFAGDDSTDTIVQDLDEELASIIRNPQPSFNNSQQPASSSTDDTVVLNVKWKPHPLNEHGKEEEFGFKLNRVCFFSPP